MDDISEKLLLCHPDLRKLYLLKYNIYKELNIPLDLFLNEDILNYKGNFYNVYCNYHNEIKPLSMNKPILSNPYNTEIGILIGTTNGNIYIFPASMVFLQKNQ